MKSFLGFAHRVGFTRFNAGPLIKLKKAPRQVAQRILGELEVRKLIDARGKRAAVGMKMKRWGPFTVSLPPSEQALLSAWLKYAAAQMGNQIPTLTGYVRLQVRVGLVNDDDGRTLGQVVPAIMALLAGENRL